MGDEEETVNGIATTASARCSSPTIELKKVGTSWKIKVDGQYLRVPANTFPQTAQIEVDGSHILTESDCFQVKLDSSGKWRLDRSEEIYVEEKHTEQENAAQDAGIEHEHYETGSTEFGSLQADIADSGRNNQVQADDAVPGRKSTNVQTSSDLHMSMVDIACGPDDAVPSRKSLDVQTSSDSNVSMVDIACGPDEIMSTENPSSATADRIPAGTVEPDLETDLIERLTDEQYRLYLILMRKMENNVKYGTTNSMKVLCMFGLLCLACKDAGEITRHLEEEIENITVDEVPCGTKPALEVRQLCQDIEAAYKIPCCMYDQDNSRCIIYHKSYKELQKVKNQLNIKFGSMKITVRRKRDFTNVNVAEVPSSPEASTPTFDWQNVKHLKFYNVPGNIQVLVYEASIIQLTVDCIVNASNDILQHGGGVAKVIARAAGRKLDEECSEYKRKHGRVPVGGNCVTTAGNLTCKRVIHAVGPRWSDYMPHDFAKVRECEDHLYRAVFSSLEAAEKEKLKSIALPALSSAIFGVPEEICVYHYAKATLDYCRKAQGTSLKEIHFVDIKSDIISEIQKMFDLMVNDGKDPGYDTTKFVKRFPPSEYPTEQGAMFYTKGQDKRGHYAGQGAGGYTTGQDTRSQHQGQDARFRCTGQAAQGFKGDLVTDRRNAERQTGGYAARRQNPVVIGNIHVHKADVFSVNAKGAAIVIFIDKKRSARGNYSYQVVQKIKDYRSYLRDLNYYLDQYPQLCVTKGYGCGYDYILHVVTENYQALKDTKEKKKIAEAYENVFKSAYFVKKVNAVILTLIGTGADDRELSISVETFKDSFDKVSVQYVDHTPLDVYLVVDTDKEVDEVCKRFNVNPVSTGHSGRDGKETVRQVQHS